MNEPDVLLAIVEEACIAAKRRGADEAEAYVRESRRLRVSRHGTLAEPTESHSIGIGLRVVKDGRIGSASSAGLHRIETVIDEALDAARQAAPRDGFEGMPSPTSYRPPTPVPDTFVAPDPSTLHDATTVVLDALDDRRTRFCAVSLSVANSLFAVANTNGVAAWDRGGRTVFDLELRVEDGGRPVTGWSHLSSVHPFHLDEQVLPAARDAERRALGALDAKGLDHTVKKGILVPTAAAQLLGWVLRMFNGQNVQQGDSAMTDRFGSPVASPLLTVHDVPYDDERGIQRTRVDHEGVPVERITLLEDGTACETYDDTLSGIGRGGSNGHANRKGWSGHVAPGLMMPEMRHGSHTFDSLIDETDEAILIEEPLTGMLTANQRTGEFSAVLPYAYLVERGEVTRALPNLTVAGNVLDVARTIDALGDHTEETALGHFPAIRCGGISCAT